MPICELCGKEGELFVAVIENIDMSVCSKCSKFGKVLKKPVQSEKEVFRKNFVKERLIKKEVKESSDVVVEDYAQLVKSAREKLGLTQEEFAKKLSEKESLIQKIESGNFTPPLDMAKKFERILSVRLIEKFEEKQEVKHKNDSKELTIGDIIKIKR